MIVDAYWLPGLDADRVQEWEIRELAGGAALRWPVLTPETLGAVVRELRAARTRVLARMAVGDIVRAIDAAAARLADPADPYRRTAEDLLPEVTGYSPAMIHLGLERMVADWRAPALETLLRAELPDPGALDHFVRDASGREGWPRRLVRAAGPELVFHVFAGNVPGVAVTSIVRSLLAKAATLGKTAAGAVTEGAGGVTVAATRKLIERGALPRDESIVICITGNGYKTIELVADIVKPAHIGRSLKDFEAVLEGCTHCQYVGASTFSTGHVKFNDQSIADTWLRGMTPSMFNIMDIDVIAGRALNDSDIRNASKVVVIGNDIVEKLMPGLDPIRETQHDRVRIEVYECRVVGQDSARLHGRRQPIKLAVLQRLLIGLLAFRAGQRVAAPVESL